MSPLNYAKIVSLPSLSRMKLCMTAHAIMMLHCQGSLYGVMQLPRNGKCFLNTPNVRSTTFRNEEYL